MFPDVIVVPDPQGPLRGELFRPGEFRIEKATVENEEFPSLPDGGPRLDQRAGRFARLDDHGRLRQRRHRRVAFGKEEAIQPVVLRFIAFDGNLADVRAGRDR